MNIADINPLVREAYLETTRRIIEVEEKMKMKRYPCIMAAIIMMAVILCGCADNANAKFNGSLTSDEEHFDIDFEILNGTYEHDLFLKEGESIAVSIEKESGSISLSVQDEDGESVYQGDDVEAGAFEVGIKETGTYTLCVSGKKARGHVVFTKKEA